MKYFCVDAVVLAETSRVTLFREDLVAAAKKAKLTGLQFIEPAKFKML